MRDGGFDLRGALAMDPVAGETRDGGFAGEIRAHDAPGSAGVLRLHQVAHGAIEIHAVTAQAVVVEAAAGVVAGVQEDLAEGGGVRPGVPARILVLVAALALRNHRLHVRFAHVHAVRVAAGEVAADVAKLIGGGGVVAVGALRVVMRRGVDGADLVRHFMAVGAGGAVACGVVEGRAVTVCNDQAHRCRGGDDGEN